MHLLCVRPATCAYLRFWKATPVIPVTTSFARLLSVDYS